jgi:hypothetical protein
VTAVAVSSGGMRNTPKPSWGMETPLLNVSEGTEFVMAPNIGH